MAIEEASFKRMLGIETKATSCLDLIQEFKNMSFDQDVLDTVMNTLQDRLCWIQGTIRKEIKV